MDVRQRLLAEMGAHDAPYGLAGRLLDPAVIAALGGAEVGQRLPKPRHDSLAQAAIRIFDTAQADDRIGLRLALAVDYDGGVCGAVPEELAPLLQGHALERDHDVAVAHQAA